MDIYLPIAEMSVNLPLLIALGAVVGMLSGLFGVGGGFLLTPMLILLGIPPAVAVGSATSQVLASSVSGSIARTRMGHVDFRMGGVLIVGGLAGSIAGIFLFAWMQALGQLDLIINLSFVIVLGVIGLLMAYESLTTILHLRRPRRRRRTFWSMLLSRLPLQMNFERSGLIMSPFVPAFIGFVVGVIAAMMGVGGGFLMVPAMIYILGMPTSVVIGTSLFQICFLTAATTFLHASTNQNVDIVLAFMLIIGGILGAQFGTLLGGKLRGEQLRILLALLVLGVCVSLAWSIFATPDEVFVMTVWSP